MALSLIESATAGRRLCGMIGRNRAGPALNRSPLISGHGAIANDPANEALSSPATVISAAHRQAAIQALGLRNSRYTSAR